MAITKNDTIQFSNGREIPLPGGIVSITSSLELADYYSRNILYLNTNAKIPDVVNVHKLTAEEVIELADMMIQLWIDLKDNIRQADITSTSIFKSRKERLKRRTANEN